MRNIQISFIQNLHKDKILNIYFVQINLANFAFN
jgi:hypothetical protein